MPSKASKLKTSVLITVAALAAIWLNLDLTSSRTEPSSSSELSADTRIIEKAFQEHKSDLLVEGTGTIVSILKDDTVGSRHQRIIIELASGHSLLIAHNIDLTNRVDEPRRGSKISFKGEYEWNERGGVIHWTHRDPDGDHPAGWLLYEGEKYW